jgi:hypothetical protein
VSAPAKAKAGQLVHLSGQGFSPGSRVRIVFDATHKVTVGSAVADGQGSFRAAVVVPRAQPGRHVLQIEGTSTDGRRASWTTGVFVLADVTQPLTKGGGLATPVLLALSVGLPLTTWVVLGFPSWRRRQALAGRNSRQPGPSGG